MIFQVAVLLFLACLWRHNVCHAYVEIVEERAGYEKTFQLTCRHLDSRIAILDAIFTPNSLEETNGSYPAQLRIEDEPYPVRLSLNHRCSGVNHCSFILHADCPISKFWGPGEIYIKYACMADRRVTRYCNMELLIPEGGGEHAQGFITTPGYPKFYLGHSECRWTIRAPHDQRVQLTLLDVSLSRGDGGEDTCEDDLQVIEDEMVVFTICKGREIAPTITSRSNVLQLRVTGRSGSLIPKRGVLLYYTSVDCPTPDPPTDGYLVHRNATAAEYMCCVGYIFPDTLKRTKVIQCLQNTWDHKIPEYCLDQTELIFNNNSIPSEVRDRKHNMSEVSNIVDVIIPSLLIAGLLCGNAIIIYIIHRYRKRRERLVEKYQQLFNALNKKQKWDRYTINYGTIRNEKVWPDSGSNF